MDDVVDMFEFTTLLSLPILKNYLRLVACLIGSFSLSRSLLSQYFLMLSILAGSQAIPNH